MPTDPHRLSPAARCVAVYLADELTPFIQDQVVRDRIADRWAQHMDAAELLADLEPSGLPRRRGLMRFRRRPKPRAKTLLRTLTRL
jgi:hypothetical protein